VHSRNVSLLLVSISLANLLFIVQTEQSKIFVYEKELFTLNDLIKKFDNSQKQINILDSESQQGFNKFIAKANYVGEQFTILVYQSVDSKNPTLLVLLIPLAGFVIIRSENEKIQFYDVKKICCLYFHCYFSIICHSNTIFIFCVLLGLCVCSRNTRR